MIREHQQVIAVHGPTQTIQASPLEQIISVDTVEQTVQIIQSGPQGVPGVDAAVGGGGVTQEDVDTSIATHNQAEIVHNNASSGRDFAALFTLGLV